MAVGANHVSGNLSFSASKLIRRCAVNRFSNGRGIDCSPNRRKCAEQHEKENLLTLTLVSGTHRT